MAEDARRIYWIHSGRFDVKADKSTWLEMARGLTGKGMEVHLVTGFKNRTGDFREYDIAIHYLKSSRFPFLFRLFLMVHICVFLFKEAVSSDIIVVDLASLPCGALIKYLKGCPLHCDFRTPYVEKITLKRKLDYWFTWRMEARSLICFCDTYSFISEGLRRMLAKQLSLPPRNYIIWESAVNCDLFRPRDGVAHEKFIVLYHGSICQERGLGRLIEAVKYLDLQTRQTMVLRFVGNGAFVPQLKKKVEELGLQATVEFKDLQPYERMPEEIAQADIGISPLPALDIWQVSSPLKVFEYFACGKPAILTPIAAHRSIVGEESFVIWTKGDDAKSFAEAIGRACRERKRLEEDGRQAREFVVKNHSWEIRVNKLFAFFSNHINPKATVTKISEN